MIISTLVLLVVALVGLIVELPELMFAPQMLFKVLMGRIGVDTINTKNKVLVSTRGLAMPSTTFDVECIVHFSLG